MDNVSALTKQSFGLCKFSSSWHFQRKFFKFDWDSILALYGIVGLLSCCTIMNFFCDLFEMLNFSLPVTELLAMFHHFSSSASLLHLGVIFIFSILGVYLDHFSSTSCYTFAFMAFTRSIKATHCFWLAKKLPWVCLGESSRSSLKSCCCVCFIIWVFRWWRFRASSVWREKFRLWAFTSLI